MSKVMEVEIRHSCSLTGPIKGMSDIVVAAAFGIMEDPGNVLTGPQAAK